MKKARSAARDNGAKTARFALPGSRHALLDNAVAKISVDQASFGALNGFQKRLVHDALPAGKPLEPSVFENPHAAARQHFMSRLVL